MKWTVVPSKPVQPSKHPPCAGAVKLGHISDNEEYSNT